MSLGTYSKVKNFTKGHLRDSTSNAGEGFVGVWFGSIGRVVVGATMRVLNAGHDVIGDDFSDA